MPSGSAQRSEAPSVSVVRSSPTRAQRGTRPKNEIIRLRYYNQTSI
ncbi:MAG: hypothetical protein NZ455_04110 [Bacteroidia bacterium]|nr:hypothetical protein [Bacteroidia bacterium]